VLKRAFFEGSS